MARIANSSIDYTSKDYEAFRNDMIAKLQEKIPEYTDTRESDAGIVIIELLAMGLDILSFYQDVYANEVYISTAQQKDNLIKWCKILGYTPYFARPAKFKQVFKLVGVQNTNTIIHRFTMVSTSASGGEEAVSFETQKDLVIPAGYLGDEQDEEGNYLFTVDVFQGSTIEREILGTSDGITKNQTFTTSYDGVIVDNTFQVYVNEGLGYELWTRVDTLTDSTSKDKVYTVTIDEDEYATITFGDGLFGKIPAKNVNEIYATYRVNGGESGNVSEGMINKLDTTIALVDGTFNPYEAYESGRDNEDNETIRVNAPLTYRTRYGALTLSDFSGVLVRDFEKVVASVSKRDPLNQDNIYIYLMLKDNEPLTSDFKQEILNYFSENNGGRKIVGADIIYLEEARFNYLNLTVDLMVEEYYSPMQIKTKVEEYLQDYFAKGNYPFGAELSFSQLEKEVQNEIAGVRFIRFTSNYPYVLTPEVGEVYALNSLTVSLV